MPEIKKSLVRFILKIYEFAKSFFVNRAEANEANVQIQKSEETRKHQSTDAMLVNSMNNESQEKIGLIGRVTDFILGKKPLFENKKTNIQDNKRTEKPTSTSNIQSNPNSFFAIDLLKPLKYSPSILDYMKFNRRR